MADEMQPHTKSEGLKRLLRRRGRRQKVGANTGDKVYSWAEYSQVNFTPSGDHSRLGWIVAGAFFVVWPGLSLLFKLVDLISPHQFDDVVFAIMITAGITGAIAFASGMLLFFWYCACSVLDQIAEYRAERAKPAAQAKDEDANRAT